MTCTVILFIWSVSETWPLLIDHLEWNHFNVSVNRARHNKDAMTDERKHTWAQGCYFQQLGPIHSVYPKPYRTWLGVYLPTLSQYTNNTFQQECKTDTFSSTRFITLGHMCNTMWHYYWPWVHSNYVPSGGISSFQHLLQIQIFWHKQHRPLV